MQYNVTINISAEIVLAVYAGKCGMTKYITGAIVDITGR